MHYFDGLLFIVAFLCDFLFGCGGLGWVLFGGLKGVNWHVKDIALVNHSNRWRGSTGKGGKGFCADLIFIIYSALLQLLIGSVYQSLNSCNDLGGRERLRE